MLSIAPYKGTRDFYPEDMRLRLYIFQKWREVLQSYGYEPYSGPTVEPTSLYLAKSGEELINEESYRFTDRGGRDVMLRPEMTPTVSRMVAGKRQELAYPARWYSIDNFFRYQRPQAGRLREFYQLNVDIFGVKTIDAELELMQITNSLFKAFGASESMYEIKVNSKRLSSLILADYLGLEAGAIYKMTKLLDKKDKMEIDDFLKSAQTIFSEGDSDGIKRLQTIISAKTMADLPEIIKNSNEVKEIQILFTLLGESGIKNASFDVTLMRGLDYYTDMVFEVFDTNPDNNRSVFGGGRYDGLVGLFGVEPLPTAGFAIGDVTFENFLIGHNLAPDLPSSTKVYLAVVGPYLRQAHGVANILRDEGINVSVDITNRELKKQLKTAAKQKIKYCLLVGEKEFDEEIFTLKDMDTGDEQHLSLERIISILAK